MSALWNFYDPLYDVVTFQRRIWDKVDPVKDKFHEIIATYEVSRLNFIRQEGVSWLAFPSASYTRFLSALGTWYLADEALKNVQVEPRAQNSNPWLSSRLKDLGLVEEFRLTALLRNIGIFPYNVTIENNDKLKRRYWEKNNIRLRHEDFTVSMIKGQKEDNDIFDIYEDYLKYKFGKRLNKKNMIANFLGQELKDVEHDWLVYLIDPNQVTPANMKNDNDRKFIRLVRHLVRGLIDIGTMDRACRASYFICGRGTIPNSRRILKSVLIDSSVGNKGKIVLFDDGPHDAVDALYVVQNVLTIYLLHDQTRMAYEVMLNLAVNIAWEKSNLNEHFKLYFPFMDDEEFFGVISKCKDEKVQKIISQFKLKDPYKCLGKFEIEPFNNKNISNNEVDSIVKERRNNYINMVEDKFHEWKCLIRLSETFGRPQKEESLMTAYDGPTSKRAAWLDPHKLYAKDHRNDLTGKLIDIVPPRLIRLVKEHEDEERNTFWLFETEKIKDEKKVNKRLEEIMCDLSVKKLELN